VNNKNSLDREFSPCAFTGSGGEIGIVDTNGLFSNAIPESMAHWTTIVDRRLPSLF
jgi:hypothetical protein